MDKKVLTKTDEYTHIRKMSVVDQRIRETERETHREKRSLSMHEAGDLKVHVEANLISQCTHCDKQSSKDNPDNKVVGNRVSV